MNELFRRASNEVAKIEKTIIVFFLLVMSVTILANTLARITGLFTEQLIWAEEFARYLMIWMAFLGAALVMKDNGHYKMTAIVDMFPEKLRRGISKASILLTLAFMVLLAKIGVDCCLKIAAMGQKSPVLKIPMWIPYAAIPAGMMIGVLQAFLREISDWFTKRDEKEG